MESHSALVSGSSADEEQNETLPNEEPKDTLPNVGTKDTLAMKSSLTIPGDKSQDKSLDSIEPEKEKSKEFSKRSIFNDPDLQALNSTEEDAYLRAGGCEFIKCS